MCSRSALDQGLIVRAVGIVADGHAETFADAAHSVEEVVLGAARVVRADQVPAAPAPSLGEGLEARPVVVLADGHTEARAGASHGVEDVVLGAAGVVEGDEVPVAPAPFLDQGLLIGPVGVFAGGVAEARGGATDAIEDVASVVLVLYELTTLQLLPFHCSIRVWLFVALK